MSRERKKESGQGFVQETVKTAVFALVIAFIIRTFLFQPFHIPSGSMEPNLYSGDYLITTKYSLGYGKYAADPFFNLPIKSGRVFGREPVRGDIIVFKPVGSKTYFIKRLIGLPGDEVQMVGGFLYINGQLLKTEKLTNTARVEKAGNFVNTQMYKEHFAHIGISYTIQHNLQNSDGDETGVFHVPDGHYFFMGDNRDNSYDSRFSTQIGGVGFVPMENLVGRAEFVLLSVKEDFTLFKPWTWGNVRKDRFFKGLR